MRNYAPDTSTAGRGGAEGAASGGGGRGGRGGAFTPAPATTAGINRFVWDLQYPGALTFPGMILWGGSTNGPAAPPGLYRVRLNVDGKEFVKPLTVKRHPLYKDVTDADLRAQFDLAIKVRDKVTEANQAVVDARRIKREAADKMSKSPDAQLQAQGSRLTASLSDVEDDIYQVKNQSGQDPLNFPIKVNNRLANLLRVVNSGDGRPIANAPVLLQEYSKQLTAQTGRMQKVLTTDLVAFNIEAKRLGLGEINPKCPSGQVCGIVP